jgi:hypothetical protein
MDNTPSRDLGTAGSQQPQAGAPFIKLRDMVVPVCRQRRSIEPFNGR